MKRHSVHAAVLAACLLLATASGASAATRYASVGGTGVAPCTDATTPCVLPTAVGTAVANDTVSVAPGTYPALPIIATLQNNVVIAGQPGADKPVLQMTFSGVTLGGTNDTLRHVAIEAPGAGIGVLAGPGATVSDVDVTAAAGCVSVSGAGATIENSKLTLTGASLGSCISAIPPISDNLTIRNVAVKSTATTISPIPTALVSLGSGGAQVDRLVVDNPKGPAVQMGSGPFVSPTPSVMRRSRLTGTNTTIGLPALTIGSSATVSDTLVQAGGAGATPTTAIQASGGKLRNVTAIATGAGSRGLWVAAPFLLTPAPTSVKNSIFRGDAATDITVDPGFGGIPTPVGCTVGIPPCVLMGGIPGGDLTINKSNFRTSTGPLNGASADNQAADPMFTDAAAGDFHPQAGSPAIDSGVDDADNGTKDLDGNDRKLGSAVDMGAYEFVPPAPPELPAAPEQPSAPANTGEPANVPAPPVVTDRIAPLLGSVSITNKTFKVGSGATAIAARAKSGTVFVYSLSEPGKVAIAMQQATPGKRKGSSCVKPTRKLRKAKKCTLYKTVGTLTRGGIGGTNAVPFSGRIGKKALKPGSYRAVFSAVDVAGNKAAKTPSVGFKIVKK